jgi:hypothetical protein
MKACIRRAGPHRAKGLLTGPPAGDDGKRSPGLTCEGDDARRHLFCRLGAQLVLHRVSANQQHHLGAGRIAQEIGPLFGGGGKARRGHLGRRDNQIEARRMRWKLEVAQGDRQVEDAGQVGAFAA